jgi:hydrocephalus-inducing protein
VERKKERKKKKKKEREVIPINEIFDILPMNGYLAPGETERVEFVFNALLSQKVKTLAVCSVQGGPDYEVQLTGDSSVMRTDVRPSELQYGTLNFNEWDSREVIIENTGKVAFDFRVDLSSINRKGLIEVTPQIGIVKGLDKAKLNVRMCPGIPDPVDEYFNVEVAHFEPFRIHVRGEATYPSLYVFLPREENADFDRHLEHEKLNQSNNMSEMRSQELTKQQIA